MDDPEAFRDVETLISQRIEERPPEYAAIVRDVLDAYMQKAPSITAHDIVELYSIVAKLGNGALRIKDVLSELREEGQPPDAAQRGAFLRYFDLVDQLDGVLQRLNIALLDVYRPGLAAAFAQIKWGDMLAYHWLAMLAPEFEVDPRDMPASLKRVLNDWWYTSSPGYQLRSTIHEPTYPFDPRQLSDSDIEQLSKFCDDMRGLSADIASVIRDNWTLAEIGEAGRPKLGVQVGDYFANVGAGAVIVNRSSLANSLNRVRADIGEGEYDAVWALQCVAEDVERSGNQAAIENFNAFTEELERPEPRKNVLRSMWDGLVASMPTLKDGAALVEQISKLFA